MGIISFVLNIVDTCCLEYVLMKRAVLLLSLFYT